MRLSFGHLLIVLGVALASAPAFAQQGSLHPAQSAEPATTCQAWQQARDTEEKIELGERALALEPAVPTWSLEIPRQRFKAELSAGLGALYANRTRGMFADNVEKAIQYLQGALTTWTREADAQDWAMAHNNLGIAYWQRIRGERADNQETAIAHFEAAQTVFSRDAAPDLWGQLQNNLAIVYWSRIQGDRAQNVEDAIAHFEAALTVLTQEKDPDRTEQSRQRLQQAPARPAS